MVEKPTQEVCSILQKYNVDAKPYRVPTEEAMRYMVYSHVPLAFLEGQLAIQEGKDFFTEDLVRGYCDAFRLRLENAYTIYLEPLWLTPDKQYLTSKSPQNNINHEGYVVKLTENKIREMQKDDGYITFFAINKLGVFNFGLKRTLKDCTPLELFSYAYYITTEDLKNSLLKNVKHCVYHIPYY